MILRRPTQRFADAANTDPQLRADIDLHFIGGGVGTLWQDYSVSRAHAEFRGFTSLLPWVTGPATAGLGVKFNGSSTYAELTTVTAARIRPVYSSVNFTFACWVKFTTTTQGTILCRANSAFASPFLKLEANPSGFGFGTVGFTSRDNSDVLSTTLASTATVGDGEWHHVCVTQTGATPNSVRLIYIDGKLNNTLSSVAMGVITNQTFELGAIKLGFGSRTTYFNGSVADVRYYAARAITSSEVATLARPDYGSIIARPIRIGIPIGRTLYVKAAGGNWNASTTWSAVSSAGGDDASPPTNLDDVIIDAGSGNSTITANITCRSLDCNGFTGTLTHNASIVLSIGDGFSGAGNRALRFSAGMTYTTGSVLSTIKFTSRALGIPQSITTAGKSLKAITFNGLNGSWYLTDAWTSSTVTMTAGTFDSNGFAVNIPGLTTSGSAVAGLIMGASTWTFDNGNWLINNSNFTIDAGTSLLTGTIATFTGGSKTYYDVTLTSGGSVSINGNNTFHNLNRTVSISAKTGELLLGSDQTITGTLTLAGNSTVNRLKVYSSVIGTARTLTAAAVSASHVDLQDVTGAGAGSWDLSAITGNSGDSGGNSGITFTTPADQTCSSTVSFSWSNPAVWTSRVPLPQDNATVNGAFGASQTITMDMPRPGKSITFGGSGTPTVALSMTYSINGSLTVTNMNSFSGSQQFKFEGRGSFTLTSGGKTFPAITMQAPGGTLTMQDAFTCSSAISLLAGTFDLNDFNLTATTVSTTGVTTRAINLGSGTTTVTATGTVWNFANVSGLTYNAETSTLVVSNTSASSKSISQGAGIAHYNVTVTGDNVSFTGSNTSITGTLSLNTGGLTTGTLLSVAIITINNITTTASAGNLAIFKSGSSGNQRTINTPGPGLVWNTDYMNLKDLLLSSANDTLWYAGSNSTNGGNNTNIIFGDQPPPSLQALTGLRIPMTILVT